jgi:ATP-dependent protease ClpP protease subunit
VHWLDAPIDINPCVVYDDVQSGYSKGETTDMLTKTKNVIATKAGARWEVVNLKTDKTVKFAKSRDAARAIRATYAKPTAYGIYDTVSQKFVR